MAIPDRQPKNRVNLEANIPGRVGLDVVAPTNVRAQQADPSNVNALLSQWAAIEHHKAEKHRAAVGALAEQQGRRDAATGHVDEPRLGADTPESKAYSRGVAEVRSETHGLRFINQAREELGREASQPDFDFDQWRTAKVSEFYESSAEGQNPEGLATLNRFASQFDQNMHSQFSAIKAKADIERATDGLADNLSEMLRSGMSTPEQVASWRGTRAANSGLDDDEVDDVVGSVLLSRLEQGDTNAFALAEASGVMQSHRWSSRFTDQRASTEARLERDRIAALDGDAERTMRVRAELGARAEAGSLTISYLADNERRGLITPEERNRAWGQQLQAQQRRVEEGRKALEKRQADAAIDALSRTGQENIRRVTAGNPKLLRQVQQSLDKQYAAGLTDALSDDPEVKARGVVEMGRVMDQAQANDMGLEYVKAVFDGADIHVPKRFEATGLLYRELIAQGKGDYLHNTISAKAHARFARFGFLIDSGQSPEEARESMARAPVKYEDAQGLARFNGRIIQEQAEKTAASLGVAPGILLPTLQSYATELYAHGALNEAPAQAAEMIAKRYVAVDGVLVRRSWFPEANPNEPEEFAEAWDDVKGAVILPMLQAKYGDDIDDVELMPDPRVPGQFLMRVPGDTTLIPDASVTSESVRRAYLKRKRDVAVQTQRAADEFAARALPPL